MQFPESFSSAAQRLRVPGGFVLLAAFVLFAQPTWNSIWTGLPVSALGLLIRAWAAGHLAKDKNLACSGPYAHVRNPLYLGSLLLAGGVVIGAHSWIMAAVFGSTFLLIYLPVIQLEEGHLRKIFPSYADYASKVPALLPRITPAGGSEPFRFSLYMKNQEWKAATGYFIALLWLIWRAFSAPG